MRFKNREEVLWYGKVFRYFRKMVNTHTQWGRSSKKQRRKAPRLW